MWINFTESVPKSSAGVGPAKVRFNLCLTRRPFAAHIQQDKPEIFDGSNLLIPEEHAGHLEQAGKQAGTKPVNENWPSRKHSKSFIRLPNITSQIRAFARLERSWFRSREQNFSHLALVPDLHKSRRVVRGPF